jgi:hypothetical protein
MRVMIFAIAGTLLALTAFAQPRAQYQKDADGVLLPDPKATPGATLSVTMHHLCTKGYTQTVRNVTDAEKQHIYAVYGAKHQLKVCCEVDHLISLELGGSNDLTNLWPEPYTPTPGAHEKDKLENVLHQAVCDGKMTLQEAQQKISTNWHEAYKQMVEGKP